jgi:acetyl-CoA C-acetyltransferase
MPLDPSTPVVVGVGQVTNRPDPGGTVPLADRPEPIGLMVDAVRAAVQDCDGSADGGAAPAGRRLLGRIQSLRVADPLSWRYINPGLLVAEALGVEPAQLMVTTTGGNNPQSLVNATALAIGRGELDVAVVVGADCVYTRTASRRHAERPLLSWTMQPADTLRPAVFGNDRRGTTEAEEERGLATCPSTCSPCSRTPSGPRPAAPSTSTAGASASSGPPSPRWRRPTPRPGCPRPAPAPTSPPSPTPTG